jgi:hypothetical protein
MLLDHRETLAVVALAALSATPAALEADQPLVHGLAQPLVVHPDPPVVLVQVDGGMVAGLVRVRAVRLKGGDGGASRDVRVSIDLGALPPRGSLWQAGRRLDEVDAVALADHPALEGLGRAAR